MSEFSLYTPPYNGDEVPIRVVEPLIRELFSPACTVAIEPFATTLERLSKREASVVRHAIPKRQGEFAAGRIAARRALAQLGAPESEIPMGTDRAPKWPPGIVGSISHAGGTAVAVVAYSTEMKALGIDIELTGAVNRELEPLVLVKQELAWIEQLPQIERQQWATVIFSAKESFYKFQYPLSLGWLDFHDVEVVIRPPKSFSVRVLAPRSTAVTGNFEGLFRMFDSFIVTALHASSV